MIHMFDSVKFGVGIVHRKVFAITDDQDKLKYNAIPGYTIQQPKDEKEEKEVSEDLMEDIGKAVTLDELLSHDI